MKILHTSEFYHPSVGGMQEVVKQLSERLVGRGHHVTVATTRLDKRRIASENGVEIAEFTISGNLVRGIKGEVEEYKKFLLQNNFDIMVNFAAQQWTTDIALPILEKIKAKKVFVPTGFSGLYWPEYRDYFNSMKDWMMQYDMNVFLSEDYRDINFAKQNNIKKIHVIPNGADEREFNYHCKINFRERYHISENDFLILHVGSHTGMKGHSEAIDIFTRANLCNAVFMIIGNYDDGCYESCHQLEKKLNETKNYEKKNKRIMVRSINREETVDAYKAADLFLFPSNIECSPIVLFECLASRTPFLVTDVGNSREIIKWTDAGILLPTLYNVEIGKSDGGIKHRIKDLLRNIGLKKKKETLHGFSRAHVKKSARILSDIYCNAEMRGRMALNGYNAWQERFTWEKIAVQYEKLYRNLCEGLNKNDNR